MTSSDISVSFRGARHGRTRPPPRGEIREREAEDDGFFYFVMDFVPGGNLLDAALEQRMKREHAEPIILSIGEALAEAHRRGHVHRDVKPVNILLIDSGAQATFSAWMIAAAGPMAIIMPGVAIQDESAGRASEVAVHAR